MEKKIIVFRKYQNDGIAFIIKHKIVVLAACPGSGKTEMSIGAISLYLKLNKGAKVLILPHSTNYLLANFHDRLKTTQLGFTFSLNLSDNVDVHVCLPQNIDKITKKYDFIIIDEAHENYLAPRVQEIIAKTKVTKQLLLTGTPSKFIGKKGYDIFIVPALDLCEKYFPKLNIELIQSAYDWSGAYNDDNEVKNNFDFNEDNSKVTMESVMVKLLDRLKRKETAEQYNEPSLLNKLKKYANKKLNVVQNKTWGNIYKDIGKTMLICKTIKQANSIYRLLKDNDVNVDSSHYENDEDSSVIANFLKNEFDVLIVVNRGRLGYSDDKLMNIIDLSGSHNPDMIYQMYARLFRGGPTMEKFYIKVTPKGAANIAMTEIAVNAALMLTAREYISIYNGKNLNDIKIPVLRKAIKGNLCGKTKNRNASGSTTILPTYTLDVLNILKDVLHDANNESIIYKKITTRELRQRLGYIRGRLKLGLDELIGIIKED